MPFANAELVFGLTLGVAGSGMNINLHFTHLVIVDNLTIKPFFVDQLVKRYVHFFIINTLCCELMAKTNENAQQKMRVKCQCIKHKRGQTLQLFQDPICFKKLGEEGNLARRNTIEKFFAGLGATKMNC